MFYKDDRLALFIDGANLYAAAKSLGFDIDYKRLLDCFAKKPISDCVAVAGSCNSIKDNGYESKRKH